MEICYDHKIFHSDFLRQSADDRDKAIWMYDRKRRECPYCGTRPEEWDEEQDGHRRAYLPVIRECEGCIIIERTNDSADVKEGRGRRAGLMRNPRLG